MTDSRKPRNEPPAKVAEGFSDDSAIGRSVRNGRSLHDSPAAGSVANAGDKASLGVGADRRPPTLPTAAQAIRGSDSLASRFRPAELAAGTAFKSAIGPISSAGLDGNNHSATELGLKWITAAPELSSVLGRSGSALDVAKKSFESLSSRIAGTARPGSTIVGSMTLLDDPLTFTQASSLSRTFDTVGVHFDRLNRAFPGGLLEQMAKADRFGSLSALFRGGSVMDAVLNAQSPGGLAALSRSRHWAGALAGHSALEMTTLLGSTTTFHDQVGALSRAAGNIMDATSFAAVGNLFSRATGAASALAALQNTSLKMSLFASAIDVLGPGASGSAAAFGSLLGNYRSRLDLQPSFWRDSAQRVRAYRESEVDDGLIDADNAATLELMIDSGVVEGRIGRGGIVVALIEAGPVRMRITAGQTRVGAYRAINAFETNLREFVQAKLTTAHGPTWFKLRVHGEVAERAKARKREALRSGEPSVHSIHFVDLGDMIQIISRKDNWSETFEAVFQRLDWVKVDLERLTAVRRPVMHARAVDSVQLCEVVLTIRRLTRLMEMDGESDAGWDDDA